MRVLGVLKEQHHTMLLIVFFHATSHFFSPLGELDATKESERRYAAALLFVGDERAAQEETIQRLERDAEFAEETRLHLSSELGFADERVLQLMEELAHTKRQRDACAYTLSERLRKEGDHQEFFTIEEAPEDYQYEAFSEEEPKSKKGRHTLFDMEEKDFLIEESLY